MGTHRHILKTLRSIALDHANAGHPDLASMARELGSEVHRDAAALASRLASLRKRQQGFERFVLTRRNTPPLSIVVMAWPANHASPLSDHSDSWGLEMALVGALEVQSFQAEASSGELILQGREWLGPGDGLWFERDTRQLRRCRNLSRHETALSLHVYGADLTEHPASGQARPAGALIAAPSHRLAASRLHG
ncbi:cysteine dioxygenase [Rhodanobacter sp. AS-Z3]|uniref:cysteine dioxygenase n=1 Tax=Rhodanobacter sp. AS-Z3 TaxID=3031330 RepID=UPI0024790858|nr:cysteine dioxygenase [Rhodanobacter sp. AS-Z3]WEN15021.1 cysteine dioxygenase [Rhodanobacter sp. AS-Z3]